MSVQDAWTVGDKRVAPEGGHAGTLHDVATGEREVVMVSPRPVRGIRAISRRHGDLVRRLAAR